MTGDVRSSGLAILRDGRLRVMSVRTDGAGQLTVADCIVHGHRADHAVDFNALGGAERRWHCTCPDAGGGEVCAHIYACEWVCHGITAPGRDGEPKGKRQKGKR